MVPLRGSHAETRESQRAVLFLFSSSSFPAFPSFTFHCHTSTSSYPTLRVCASTYPFRPFRWNGGGGWAVPVCVPFGSCGRLSFSLSMSFSSSPFCPFCFSSLLPVAATLSTRLLLPLLITSLLYLVHVVVRVEFLLFLVYFISSYLAIAR